MLAAVFFTLGSWGNSDTTRFSHYMEWQPERAPPEPFWRLVRPLVLLLPYRMAAIQGLVAAGFATAPILLARHWRVPSWAGWWSLLICCSPMLRGFLQNAHTRQALALLVLLPLMLWLARQISMPRAWIVAGAALSALIHTTVVLNLAISLAPLLFRLAEVGDQVLVGLRGLSWHRCWQRWPLMLLAASGLVLVLLAAPVALNRFHDYAADEYFNNYTVRPIVHRLQRALAFSLVLACIQKRLDPRRLLLCPITGLLLFYGLLYLGIQASITHLWLPQITSRLADGVAFYQLITFLAWIHHYRAYWCVIPPLYVSFQYWFEGRILPSARFACSLNDEFLCIPDRWPWQVRY
jgi:hypothetical protein